MTGYIFVTRHTARSVYADGVRYQLAHRVKQNQLRFIQYLYRV